jgi:mRNA-degrading endonuclease RelE of RelBE toxin-antitoxin system
MIKHIKKYALILLAVVSLISVAYLISISTGGSNLIVNNSIPANNATEVPVTTSNIIFSFNKNIPSQETKNLTYIIQPETPSEFLISGNHMTIGFKENLQKGTTYTIDVKYNNKLISETKFETEVLTQEEISKFGALQTNGDLVFGKAYENMLTKYPWYQKIPIETSQYRVIYDFDKQMFRIRILDSETSDQIKTTIQTAVTNIEQIGVSAPIKYYVLDINGNQL